MLHHGIIVKKIGMTRIFNNQKLIIPVTLLRVESQKITRHLKKEKEGYNAVQIGYFVKKKKNLNSSDVVRLKKAEIEEYYTRFQEMRVFGFENVKKVGEKINIDDLEGWNYIDATGKTKGRGFQGSIKRWGHRIGPASHGSRFHRRTGSLGQRTTPGFVYKNKKMPGHMGNKNRTVQNLKIVDLDKQLSLIAIKGCVPGCLNSYVRIHPSVKKS